MLLRKQTLSPTLLNSLHVTLPMQRYHNSSQSACNDRADCGGFRDLRRV